MSSATTEGQGVDPAMKLKLMVDKGKNRVVFAEVDHEFMDILFSFLTLPLGTIAKLLGQDNEHIGSLQHIYASVSSLGAKHFRTSYCKNMLLSPKNAAEVQCKKLKININPFPEHAGKLYICYSCNNVSIYLVKECSKCGFTIKDNTVSDGNSRSEDGVFVKGGGYTFMITDDLRIFPASITTVIALFKELGIDDSNELEERTVEIQYNEVLQLLKFSLFSKSTFTSTFILKKCVVDIVKYKPMKGRSKKTTNDHNSSMTLKLLISKSKKRILFAEAGVDVVDFIFSFLTFPLGTVIKLTGESTGLGCIDNLYKMAQELSTTNYIKSGEYKAMLLSPKLPPKFSLENNLLQVNELQLVLESGKFKYVEQGVAFICVSVLDPKSPTEETDSGKGYLKNTAKFMITDNLVVTHFSPLTCVAQLKQMNVSINDVEECTVTMGSDKALNMLKASLLSKFVLNDVFSCSDLYPEEKPIV